MKREHLTYRTDRNYIAEGYEHTWSGDEVELHFYEGESKVMSEGEVYSLIDYNGWDYHDIGKSGFSIQIYEEINYYYCKKHHSQALYDSLNDTYFCPVCEQ